MSTKNSNKNNSSSCVIRDKKIDYTERRPVPQGNDIRFSTPPPPNKDLPQSE